MKQVKYLIFTILLPVILIQNILTVDAYVEVKESTYTHLKNNETLIDINDDYYLVDTTLDTNNQIILYYQKQAKLAITGEYQTHTWGSDLLFLVTSEAYYKVSLTSFQVEKVLKAFDQITKIIIKDNCLWLVGSNSGDALLVKMDYGFKIINQYQYGGNGKETFVNLFWFNNDPIVLGIKDAHSYQGPFANVGSLGEQKPFIVRLTPQYTINKVIYFNHESGSEAFGDAFASETQLYFYLQTKSKLHYYQLDSTLTCVRHEVLENSDNTKGLLTPSNFFIHVSEINNEIMWWVVGEALEKRLIGQGEIIDLDIQSGELVVYVKTNNMIRIINVDEYHIKKSEPLTLSYYEAEDLTKNIDIVSYFEALTVEVLEVDPFFVKTMPGDYNVTYVVKRLNGKDLYETQTVTVLPYANVINGGVYKAPFTLSFFGKGHLNGERIHSGYQIEAPGEYELVLLDGHGQERSISFTVCENYSRSEGHIVADYYVELGESVKVKLHLDTYKPITALYINGEPCDFIQEGSDLFVNLSLTSIGSRQFNISHAIDETKQIIPINKTIMLAPKRQMPQIQIKEAGAEALSLELALTDPDNALLKLQVELYDNQKLLKVMPVYLENMNVFFDLSKEGRYQIKIKAIIEQGDGLLHEKELLTYEGDFSKKTVDFASIKVNRTGRMIEGITIDVNTNNDALTHHAIKVLNQNITAHYQKQSNNLTTFIALGMTIIIIVVFGINRFFQNKRKTNH